MYDLIVVGGGVSGVAAAVSAAKDGCKVAIIERLSFLGGSATGALVTPMMKNSLEDGTSLCSPIQDEILNKLKETGDSIVFSDGNSGWFNPEILKCVLDDLIQEHNIDVLFDTVIINVEVKDSNIKAIECISAGVKKIYESKYYIDATGNADLAAIIGLESKSGHDGKNQAMTLRFNMANIDMGKFAEFLLQVDPDSGVSPISYMPNGEILLSTAYTWEDKDWKLKPYFVQAVQDGVLTEEDTAYFQLFSIPGQIDSVSFNCPRIYSSDGDLNPLEVKDISKALIIARKQIRRLACFCQKYLPGFEQAYISQIAPMLGVRDSRRIEGMYELSQDDILAAKKFDTAAAKSNYPIDVHSAEKNCGGLTFIPSGEFYEIPLEVMLPKNIDNMLVTGRAVCATFNAQAALRIQPTCISLGEAAGKYVASHIKG